MLPAKPWKSEAVMRFLMSVFICWLAGLFVVLAMRGASGSAGSQARLLAGAALVCFGVALAGLRGTWNCEVPVEQGPLRTMMPSFAVCVGFIAGLVLGARAIHLAGPMEGSITPGQMIVALLSLQGAVLVLAQFFIIEHSTSWAEAFGFGNGWRKSVLAGLLLAFVFLPFGSGMHWASDRVLTQVFHWQSEDQMAVETLRAASNWGQRLELGLGTILLAPAAEEVLFRGILYPWVRQFGYPRLALWGTSLLFALMHNNAASFVPLLVLAMALALLYEWSGNLLAPMSAHALFNAINFTILFCFDKPSA
jgi:membrane protease YdiL (CAAX protease family)